jgi:hypothetical protein
MKMNYKFFISSKCHSFSTVCMVAVTLQFGVLAGSAQTGDYLYSGSEQIITLDPGLYDITAYGAAGGGDISYFFNGSFGAEMSAQFNFASAVTLTLLVGGAGGDAGDGGGGGGGGGSFVVNGSVPLVVAAGAGGNGAFVSGGSGLIGTSGSIGWGVVSGVSVGGVGGTNGYGGGSGEGSGGGSGFIGNGGGYNGGSSFLNGGFGGGNGGFGGGAGGDGDWGGGGGGYSGGGGGGSDGGGGGGGGSIIDSSAIIDLAEVSGIASPDDSTGNGEIIITEVPEPTSLALAGLGSLFVMLFRRRRK